MSNGRRNSIRASLTPSGASPLGMFWRELFQSFRNPEFWALSSWLDTIVKARKSRFGIFWLMAPSVIYVFGLGSFFASIQHKSIGAYAAHIALGAMVFRTLMSSFIESAGVFSSSSSFIMDGHVRLTDYLLESLAKSFFNLCMYLPVTVIAMYLSGDVNLHGLLLAPLTLALIYVNALWIAVVFSMIGARHPDFSQLLGNTSIFLFLLTPIIWYAEEAPPDSMRGELMRFNPFYHFVTLFRAPILGEQVEIRSLYFVAIMTILGLGLATFVYRRYARYIPLWI